MVPVLAGADVHPPAALLRMYRFTSAGGRASDVEDRVGHLPQFPLSHLLMVMLAGSSMYGVGVGPNARK